MAAGRARSFLLALAAIAAVAALAVGVLSVAGLSSTTSNAELARSASPVVGTALAPTRPTPPFGLIDEQGAKVTLQSFRGKWVVLAPSMTLCHEVCPMTTGAFMQLSSLLRRRGLTDRVVVAEVTVDPWRDSPARLRSYRRLTDADFTMLTGTQSEIRSFWKFFGVFYQRVPEGKPADIDWLTHKPETFDVEHTDGLFILDPDGRERIADEGMADVGGQLSPALRRLLDQEGRENLARPQAPWTAEQVLEDLRKLMSAKAGAGEAPFKE
jgi:protein SCO1/2